MIQGVQGVGGARCREQRTNLGLVAMHLGGAAQRPQGPTSATHRDSVELGPALRSPTKLFEQILRVGHMPDIAISLAESTPAPLSKYLHVSLVGIQFKVTSFQEKHGRMMYVIALPAAPLKAHADCIRHEKPPQLGAARTWSEQRAAVCCTAPGGRITDGAGVAFTPAERACIITDYLESALLCDATGWHAALVASGLSDPSKSAWHGQPLLSALTTLGYLSDVSPVHGPGHHASVGLSLTRNDVLSRAVCAFRTGGMLSVRCCNIDHLLLPVCYFCLIMRIESLALQVTAIREYWGESVALCFEWQQFYIRALTAPALAGLIVWGRRPTVVSVDDDPFVPLFSLLAVVWAMTFVTCWRSRERELAFLWGTVDVQRSERIRPQFTGKETVDPISGRTVLAEPAPSRIGRLALSGGATLLSLLVPVCAMLISLNLQGYIVAATGSWLGMPVHIPVLAQHAAPGGLFNADSGGIIFPYIPVVLHALTIQVLNSIFRRVAFALTKFENHRHESMHQASLLIKRFAFEACDCYLVLFYIAFELQDVPKLRSELIALFTVDTIRRVTLETALPLLVNWSAGSNAFGGGDSALATRPSPRKANGYGGDDWDDGAAQSMSILAELELDPYDDFDVRLGAARPFCLSCLL